MAKLRPAVIMFLLVSGYSAVVHAGTVTFNFDSDAAAKATPFTDTVSGLSATFSSTGDPGGFVVLPTFFQSLTGNLLLDPGPAGLNNLPLTIQFSAPQVSIRLNFGTNSGAGVPLILNALNGATLVGTASASGTIPVGFTFPEGILTFSSGTLSNGTGPF